MISLIQQSDNQNAPMSHQDYTRLPRRWRGRIKGFRINCHRFSVRRLRARILAIFRLLGRCFETLRGDSRRRRWLDRNGSSRKGLVARPGVESRSCARSNTFYAEAIADCLDFIKRNSVSSAEDSDGFAAGMER